MRPPAIFLLGPTAVGKTDLAVALAEILNTEIVSVDSALVYQQMDIGTAKPDAATLARAPHHLIDIRDPAEVYSAGDFRRDALQVMQQLTDQGKVPLLAGGTSLYFQRLLAGETNLPPADPQIRAKLEAELQVQGAPALHQRLSQLDPESAARIAPTDPQRLVRALELWQLTGKTRTQLWQEQSTPSFPWRVLQLGLLPPQRAWLHERINLRFDLMLQSGFVEEVEELRARPDLHLGLPSMKSVGYRQVWQYLDGQFDWDAMRAAGQAATRQLAKRQLTWMRGWEGLQSIEVTRPELIERVSDQVMRFCETEKESRMCSKISSKSD